MIPEVTPFTCSQQHLAGQCIKCVGKYLLGESDHATNVCCRWIVFCFSTLQLQTVNHTHNWSEGIIQLSAKWGEKKDVPFRKESVVNILVSHQCFGFHIPQRIESCSYRKWLCLFWSLKYTCYMSTCSYLSCLQVCKQETLLPGGKVENLMTDYAAIDLLKPKTEKTVIMCTSCKANEEAIARCGKCPNFLCSHCTAAHQFMRCFDDHKVSCPCLCFKIL